MTDALKLIVKEEEKPCSRCKKIFKVSEDNFYKQKTRNKKYGEHYILTGNCKKCASELAMQYAKNNPEKHRRAQKKYSSTPRRRELRNAGFKKWREEGKQKEYYEANKDKFKEYRLRHDKKRHILTKREWTDCKNYFDNSCAYCGVTEIRAKEMYGNLLHKEHLINDEKNDLSNCVPSCKKCNVEKDRFEFEYWYLNRCFEYNKDRHERINRWINQDYKKYIDKIS